MGLRRSWRVFLCAHACGCLGPNPAFDGPNEAAADDVGGSGAAASSSGQGTAATSGTAPTAGGSASSNPTAAATSMMSDSEATSETGDGPWSEADCGARVRLSFDNTMQGEALHGFPVLVDFDAAGVDYALLGPEGAAMRFVDDDGATVLSYELEAWSDTGPSFAWVNVPEVEASSADDFAHLYFGCAEDTAQDSSAVWDPHYDGVWHLGEALTDSTSGLHDGSDNGSAAALGMIAGARAFDGSGAHVDVGAGASLRNAATVSVWARYNDLSPGVGDNMLVSCAGPSESTEDNYRYTLNIQSNRELHMFWEYGVTENYDSMYSTVSASVDPGSWHHYAFVRDDADQQVEFYVDGEPLGSAVSYSESPGGGINGTVWIGAAQSGPAMWRFDGDIDEVRISTEQLSAAWIRAQHLSMTGAFVTYGSVESSA